MGRLSDQIIRCMVGACDDTCKYYRDNACANNELMKEVEEKLKVWQHYEDLEEQGRLIELPCAVGDTVWFYQKAFDEICEARIIKFEFNCFTEPQLWIEVEYVSRLVGEQTHKGRVDLMLGKIVFLTKEEAEAKLRDLLEIENVKVFKEKVKELKELEG